MAGRPVFRNRPKARSIFTRLFSAKPLLGLGRPQQLAAAWSDHRREVPGTLDEASREAVRLLECYPELVVVEGYSSDVTRCVQCRAEGPFRPAPSGRIIDVLGS